MSPTQHTLASIATSGVFFTATGSWTGTLTCLISGILIDVDHHFDIWIYRKKFLWKLKDLYHFCDKEKKGRLHLIFHSYELLVLFWILIFLFKLSFFWSGMAVGVTIHILLDQLFNELQPWTYFFTYRLKHGFSKACVFTPDKYRQMK